TISDPVESATLGGLYTVYGQVGVETAPLTMGTVEFSLNGGAWTAATGNNGTDAFTISWDTTLVTDGPATVQVRGFDPDCGGTNLITSAVRNVTIDNSGPSNTLADCAGCHNYPPVDAASRDAATGNFIGDHDKHSAYTCATCHVSPATETFVDFAHRTGNLDIDSGNIGVGADTGTYSKGATFAQSNSPTGGTCSNVDCHNNAVTPQWGVGTTACNSCHTLPPATNAHAAHYTAKGWAADNTNCTVCHPDNTVGHSDVTDASVTVNAGLGPVGTSPAITCATTGIGCHNEKTTPAWNTTNIACTSCHTAGGAAAGDPTTGLHATTNLTDHDGTLTGGTGLACEKCHTASPSNLHFNGTVNNGGTATFAWNTSNIPASYDRTNDFCAAVCHTDSGTWNRAWSGVTDAAWAYANDATTTAVCGNCHGSFLTGWNIIGATSHDNPDVDNDPDTLATSKGSHSECSACHAWGHTNYTTGTMHENTTLETNSTLGYDNANPDAICSTNCHSGMTLTMKSVSGWTDASVAGDGVTCGGCHTGGVTPGSASGAHTVHGATAASVAANPASVALCIECHGNDGTGASHNNGTVNFVGATYSTATRNDLTGTCSTTSCHNKGTDQSTAWNTTALACNDCHYFEASPTAANNTAHASALSTSHGDHFSAGKTCAQCHGTDPVAGDTSHINGGTTANSDKATALQDEATLAWTDASAVTDYTFDDTGNTCYSATNNGLGCHATAGAAGAADATRPDWDVAFASTACTNCHTNTTNTLVNPTSGLHGVVPSVSAEQHDDNFAGGAGSCASCHTSIPVYTTHKDGTFAGGNGQTSTMGLAAFYTQTANDTGTCATTTCHLGNSDAWAHRWMATANYSNATASCTGCHGNLSSGWNAGVDHLTGEIATDHADDATASNYGCEACHALQASTGVYPFTFGTADWLPLNAGNKHGNNLITMNDDGGGTISNWQRGTGGNSAKSMCLKCHTNWTDSAPQHWFVNTTWTPEEIVGDGISAGHGVGAACVSCHDGFTQGTRRDVGLEFNLTRQHGTNAPTSADCEKCHDESSGPAGDVVLKVWDAAGTGFTTVTYVSTDLASVNTHCVSCHDTTRNVTVGGLSPPARSMANFTSTQTYNNHNFTTATGAVVPQKAKAISPHGNPNGNQLKETESIVTTAMGCLHCHPSHGSGTASKTATADANGTAVSARMLGGKPSELASVGYDYPSEGALSDPALCWDCHDNKGVADYYGDTTTGHWDGGTWKSPTFAYKTGKGGVSVLHIADKVDGGTASDAAASIVCTTCHDVHGSPTVAQFYSPALKGQWLTSPYYEDRAPPSKASGPVGLYAWADADSTARSANDAFAPRAAIETGTVWAPKEIGGGYGIVGTQDGAWGWFIDGNTFGMSAYQPYTSGAVTQKYMSTLDTTAGAIGTFGGLCMTSCHSAANIEANTAWTGHNPVVPGFGGGDTATDLFNVNGTTNPATAAKVRNQMVGQGWYNNADYGQRLFATGLGGERQGGDNDALDARTYSHSKAFSYGVNPVSAGAQANFHQFPCSKCHNPHASELPALMRTNCLNTAKAGMEWRMAAESNNCHRVETTGGYIGAGDPYPGTGYPATHGGATNGGWNAVTPW
ncbi:MAG: CxxxxCH/CxxCH domain-containing protein, partial [Desulfuromonadales bacterium]|nr:CxxxxCH/CxxCH domain-containing protein [Desulfuromonadales bacterium]